MELLCEELSEQVFIVGGHQSLSRMEDSRLWLTLGCSLQVEKYLGETLNKQYRVLHPGRQDLQYEQSAPQGNMQGNMNAVATVVREAPAV